MAPVLCHICGKSFGYERNWRRHMRSVHNIFNEDDFKCRICSYRTSRSDMLKAHYRAYHKLLDGQPPSAGTSPSGGAVPLNGSEDSAPTDQAGPSNRVPPLGTGLESEASSPQSEEFGAPPAYDPGNPDDPAVLKLLRNNRRFIKTSRRVSRRVQDRYNFEMEDVNPQQIERYVRTIFAEQAHPFRLNAAFGFVLRNTITGQYIFYYASRNNRIREHPMLIRTIADVQAFCEHLRGTDVLEYCRQQRPNTKYIVTLVSNMLFYVDKIIDFPNGAATELPSFVRRRRCIISLNKDRNGKLYSDNYCLFRCYLYHQTGNPFTLQKELDPYIERYCDEREINRSTFRGITLKQLPVFEDVFQVNIEVYSLEQNEDNDVRTRARRHHTSRRKYEDTMNINLFGTHFSYITDIRRYADTFECSKCRKLFHHRGHLKDHESSCNVTTSYVFPGGGYGAKKSIFEKLEENGIEVAGDDRFYPFRIAYDFEAMSVHIEDQKVGKKTRYIAEHVPVSVAIHCNVPNHTEPQCFVSEGDPNELVSQLYEALQAISTTAYDLLCEKYVRLINELDYYKLEYESLTSQADEMLENGDAEGAQKLYDEAYPLKIYNKLAKDFDRWLSQIPVLGFNSSKYDLNLIRQYLFPYLVEKKIEVKPVKKRNEYLMVTTKGLLFLDVIHYVAAGTSYAKWLKASDVEQQKGYFPYQWFDCIEKLSHPSLPPADAFWSDLTQSTISSENYAYLQRVWSEKGFKTVRDLLIWYNLLDVVPFISAANKMFEMWKALDIDCFKGGMISLPGLALTYMVNTMDHHTVLPLFDERTKDIYETMRANVTGGLSLVVHRHYKKGTTKLPNGSLCESIYCHDANSLYLWSLGEEMGTGLYQIWRPTASSHAGVSVEWKPEESMTEQEFSEYHRNWDETSSNNMLMEFRRKPMYPYAKSELAWLEWTAYKTGARMEHRFNGRPRTIYVTSKISYRVDGYDRATNTLFLFHGCYFHSHRCSLDKNQNTEEVERKQDENKRCLDTLRDLGYQVVVCWECEWREEKKSNPAIQQFIDENLNTQVKKYTLSAAQIVEHIKSGKLFGLVECDIAIKPWDTHLMNKFESFPPICKNVELTQADLSPLMREYAVENGYMTRPTKQLISSFWGQKIMLTTPMIRWLLNAGLEVTRVYQVIEMNPKRCFANVRDTVIENRRLADADPAYASLGEYWKTLGNSCYGKTITRKEDHKDTKVVSDPEASRLVNQKNFNKMEEVGPTAYEVCQDKDKIMMDLPISVAFFVYNHAKLKMLQFVYDFLHKYLIEGSYQIILTDTDSIMAAYASDNLDDLVKPELKEEYLSWAKAEYLVTNEEDKRTPGKFKEEAKGDEVVALCSKTYTITGENERKVSTKGLSKKTNNFVTQDFLDVLKTKQKGSGTNYGLKPQGDRVVHYSQQRDGLSYLYAKRAVQPDGVSTKALFR